MQAIGLLLGGALTWTIAFGLLGGTMFLGLYCAGLIPPNGNDRGASFLFIGGGAMTMILILAAIAVIIAAINYK